MPQPPPRNTTVVSGSDETSRPPSKTSWMRSVPPNEESSKTTVSSAYLLLTSNNWSTAQKVLNRRPEESRTVWNWKSSRKSERRYRSSAITYPSLSAFGLGRRMS